MKRPPKSNFPRALRSVRKARGIAQEAFDQVSSRNYVSVLERGLKAPTIGKVEQLSTVMRVHPLTLFAAAYLGDRFVAADVAALLDTVAGELSELIAAKPQL